MMARKGVISIDGRSELAQAGDGIVRMYQDWGKPDKAEWRQKVKESALPAQDTAKTVP
jgi:hypothetical protein